MPARRANERPTSWWLQTLERRRERMHAEYLDLSQPVAWGSEAERAAAVKFFNAAFRAEESGLRQAHELADEVRSFDPTLAEVLRLYGDEEGWHRQLLTEFMPYLGGTLEPMGRVTSLFYRLYARADRMETIVLTNLMFETIGSTTYRMALANVTEPSLRQMLTILTRDEAFHVPLNVHFLKCVLARKSRWAKLRLRLLHRALFLSLLLLPLASRPKARAFDQIGTLDLVRGYARMLDAVFAQTPELGLAPPRLVLWALGVAENDLASQDVLAASVEAAEEAADRSAVSVTALR